MKSKLMVGTFAAAVLFSLGARSTVDDLLEFTYAYDQLQSGDTCLAEGKMWAMLGIPPASAMIGSLKPVLVYKQEEMPEAYMNINLLATDPPMVPAYVSDWWNGSVLDYTMSLDVRALSLANGTGLEGRYRTIRAAKLALLAMARNLHRQSGGRYRLWLRFTGLPSQTGLPGTRLYATTSYPYSAASGLLAAYTSELIDLNHTCPR